MDGLVQRTRKAIVDAGTVNDWADVADHLSDHRSDFRICVFTGSKKETTLANHDTFRDELVCQSGVYADPVRSTQPALGRR